MQEDQLLAERIALWAEVREIMDRVTSLEKENITLSENQEIQLKLINQLRDASRKAPESTMPAISSSGKKTAAGIANLKSIFKARGGAQTFRKLQEDLDMSPSEFTYRVGCLDKRSFEVSRRPGTKRGEKILSLKVRIMEPVFFNEI
jgi:hypothetical protein